ncbi:DgyrCDS9754 [Dimorphilus gyrociliatus]|uniref:DgyrCDS9754 n=1 Tax=Dimorphilus gyrociliatus TaxID=2664684 RepID=A0A7I8VZJ9_9ANNE|nr:DgyrCDS9754 [Dimorphilus gyrociliatus]
MSPDGIPFLKIGNTFISQFINIVDFLTIKECILYDTASDEVKCDVIALCSLLLNEVTKCELYLTWLVDDVFYKVTRRRYAGHLFFVLKHLIPYQRRNQIRKELGDFASYDLKKVLSILELNLTCIAEILQENTFVIGNDPTEIDALVFGHVYALLTTDLPGINVVQYIPENLKRLCKRMDDMCFKGQHPV